MFESYPLDSLRVIFNSLLAPKGHYRLGDREVILHDREDWEIMKNQMNGFVAHMPEDL